MKYNTDSAADFQVVLNEAKKVLFKSLTEELKKEMQETLDLVKAENIGTEWIEVAFDEVLHDFMRHNFTEDYDAHDVASEFYQFYGCDTRIIFEEMAHDKLNNDD